MKTILVATDGSEPAAQALEVAIQLARDTGAALEVRSSRNIPEHFTLALRADRQRIPCHIVWRNEERLGVAFDWLT